MLTTNDIDCKEIQNNGFSAQVIQKYCANQSQESDGRLSDQGFESVRSNFAPKIPISVAKHMTSATSSAPTSPRNDLSQPESRKNMVTTSLNPLRVSANFERDSRIKYTNNQLVLKPDQILLKHEHTSTNPFNFLTEGRCGELKGSIYKRNLDEYERQVNNSLRAAHSASRAQDRLNNF